MLLSMIIPVYNGENKIEKCLKSLTALREQDIEFIIVDDGSIDNTKSICDDYALKDRRFCVITQKNGGVSSARNTGLNKSQGKFISFIDADDEITSEYNQIIDIIKKEESDFYSFDFYVKSRSFSRKQKRQLYSPGKNAKEVLYNNFLQGNSNNVWCNIYRAEIIKNNKLSFPTNMSMGEDCVFNARYLRFCESVYYINLSAYTYYIDDQSSASYARKLSYLQDFAKTYESYMEIYGLCDNLALPQCGIYDVNNVYGILKRHRTEMSKSEKKAFKKTKFCQALLSQTYVSLKHETKKWMIKFYLI